MLKAPASPLMPSRLRGILVEPGGEAGGDLGTGTPWEPPLLTSLSQRGPGGVHSVPLHPKRCPGMGEGDAGGRGSVPSRPPRGGTGQHSHWWGRGRAPPRGLGSQGSEVAVVLVLARQPVGGAQRHPVALVQLPHAVALVMHVVGDVLQILQVGPARGGSEEEGHQVTVTRTAPVVGGAPNPPTSP